jgi:RecA/RadA recombinase
VSKKFLDKMRKMEGAVITGAFDPLKNCARSPMPSVNWAFGIPGGGIPYGFSMLLYGPPKGGKSYVANTFVAQCHADHPEGIVINFNTELRGLVQCNETQLRKQNIDPERYQVFDVNQPELIFDRIEHDVAAWCEEGAKIKMIIIDSLTHIQGRRSMNATTVNQQQIGDHAQTISVGLKRIIPVLRKYGIAFICTDHVRAELDQHEIMRGNTTKMASAWAAKHVFEYFCYVEPNKTKEGRTDLLGNEFVDPEITDFMKKNQKTGLKMRFQVKESSFGKGSGRTAEFTMSFDEGVINQFEEVFKLGMGHGIIEKPNNQTYKIGEESYRGAPAILAALRDNELLCKQVLDAVWMKEYNEPYYK